MRRRAASAWPKNEARWRAVNPSLEKAVAPARSRPSSSASRSGRPRPAASKRSSSGAARRHRGCRDSEHAGPPTRHRRHAHQPGPARLRAAHRDAPHRRHRSHRTSRLGTSGTSASQRSDRPQEKPAAPHHKIAARASPKRPPGATLAHYGDAGPEERPVRSTGRTIRRTRCAWPIRSRSSPAQAAAWAAWQASCSPRRGPGS